MSGEIEDESHFVVDCAFYDDLREKFKNVLMKEGIEFGEERKTEAGKKRLMQLLLGTGLQGANKEAAAKLRQETLNFCRGAMRWRRAVVLGLVERRRHPGCLGPLRIPVTAYVSTCLMVPCDDPNSQRDGSLTMSQQWSNYLFKLQDSTRLSPPVACLYNKIASQR